MSKGEDNDSLYRGRQMIMEDKTEEKTNESQERTERERRKSEDGGGRLERIEMQRRIWNSLACYSLEMVSVTSCGPPNRDLVALCPEKTLGVVSIQNLRSVVLKTLKMLKTWREPELDGDYFSGDFPKVAIIGCSQEQVKSWRWMWIVHRVC